MNPGKKQKAQKYKRTSEEETEPTHQSTSLQGIGNRKEDHKLRVQASGVQSLQARGPGTQGTSVQAGPGHKLPGQKYFFYG